MRRRPSRQEPRSRLRFRQVKAISDDTENHIVFIDDDDQRVREALCEMVMSWARCYKDGRFNKAGEYVVTSVRHQSMNRLRQDKAHARVLWTAPVAELGRHVVFGKNL